MRRGFAANYLFPKKEVLFANEKNLAWLEKQKAKKVQEDLLLEEKAHQIYGKLNNFSLTFILKKDDKGVPFGSVGFKEILAELEKSGFHLEKSQLLEFHPLNKLGENIVPVKLSTKITANLKITVK